MIVYNPDYYPTPDNVLDIMLDGEQIKGKVCYEPQAGTGHIVERLVNEGAKEVLASEKDEDFVKLLRYQKCRIIGDDFFTVKREDISHVDIIVMNPPFSNAADHINYAFINAPDGCRIISLCNLQTLENPYSKSRQQLVSLVQSYGQYQNLGNCFSDSERKTDVEVALIRIQKPASNYEQEFSGFFIDEEDDGANNAYGIMSYNAIRDLVNRYVESIKIYDQQLETAVKLNEMQAGYFDKDYERSDRQREKGTISVSIKRGDALLERNTFKKQMQKAGWRWIFDTMNMDKYSTRGLKNDINKFVEQQENVPFTMKNIYKMLEIVIGTTDQRMDKAILEVFDKVTKHHDDNKYGLEGWKTNSYYLLTKKFILPYIVESSWTRGWSITHYSERYDIIDDLHKALCYITGKNYDEIGSIWEMNHRKNENGERIYNDWGTWIDFGMFRMKAFKKGTVHFEFKDEHVWGLFNQRVAKLKGYPLPEKKEQTAYQKRQNGWKSEKKVKKDFKVMATIKI